jgi:hypothetical protein
MDAERVKAGLEREAQGFALGRAQGGRKVENAIRTRLGAGEGVLRWYKPRERQRRAADQQETALTPCSRAEPPQISETMFLVPTWRSK